MDIHYAVAGTAAILALLTPIIFVTIHHEVRLRRIRLIHVLSKSFGSQGEGTRSRGLLDSNPSFEVVKSKYAVDLGPCPPAVDAVAFANLDVSNETVDRYLHHLRWYHLASSRRILFASIPYSVFSAFGLFAILYPILKSSQNIHITDLVPPCLLTVGGMEHWSDDYYSSVLMIGAAAFLGAYLFTLRSLVRSIVVFDLSQSTVVRAAVHIVISVIGTIVLWRSYAAFGAPTNIVAAAINSPVSYAGLAGGSTLLGAFLLGYVEDLWIEVAIDRIQYFGRVIKRPDRRFGNQTLSIPLAVIDGIDYLTGFRLEEANIFEVQNLATYNPLMLHVETPFSLYQVIDWVAQAQLCAIVGPERFLLLRQFNVRTIFDLEQAVLNDAPEQMVRFIGTMLIMPTQISREILEITKTKYVGIGQHPKSSLDSEQFEEYLAALFSEATHPEQATIKHFVSVMLDDLHVRRLRQIWTIISSRLESQTDLSAGR